MLERQNSSLCVNPEVWRICLDLIELSYLMCLLSNISVYFFFSLANHYMKFEGLIGWVWGKKNNPKQNQNCLLRRISILEGKCFWTYHKFWQKTCKHECFYFIACLFLMLERNVNHLSLQRFSPDGWTVVKQILRWYDGTPVLLLFISIQINYRYPIRICKLSLFFRQSEIQFSISYFCL